MKDRIAKIPGLVKSTTGTVYQRRNNGVRRLSFKPMGKKVTERRLRRDRKRYALCMALGLVVKVEPEIQLAGPVTSTFTR